MIDKEQVLKIARECGETHPGIGGISTFTLATQYAFTEDELEAFAAAMYAKGAEDMREQVDTLENLLLSIGHFAHDNSTGPAVPDALWAVRGMAYELV